MPEKEQPTTDVLVVEDGDLDAAVTEAALKRVVGFVLTRVTTLREARDCLDQRRFGVVILDLNLPDSSGLATFSALHELHSALPIVILTGADDEALAIEALSLGAQDYVSKNDLNPQLLGRSLRYAIERQARLEAERNNLRIQSELRIARNIQRHMLPASAPNIAGFEIAAICEPADECGGDFFDFFRSGESIWNLVVGDVSGHGLGPALITVGARRALRMGSRLSAASHEVLAIANSAVFEDTSGDYFLTLFLGRLNTQERKLHYSAAGQQVWCLNRRTGARALRCDGLPLGILPNTQYDAMESLQLECGDVLLIPTDGLFECYNASGAQLGQQTMLDVAMDHLEQPARTIQEKVIERVREFCAPANPGDDLTIMVVKVVD